MAVCEDTDQVRRSVDVDAVAEPAAQLCRDWNRFVRTLCVLLDDPDEIEEMLRLCVEPDRQHHIAAGPPGNVGPLLEPVRPDGSPLRAQRSL